MSLAHAPSRPSATPAHLALALGRPRFTHAGIAEIARAQGAAAAWQAALARAAGPGAGAHGKGTELAVRAAAMAEGDFAVGLTDSQGRGFAAVDRFAIQTLCWRVVDGRIHFAERADTLAALPPRAGIDPQAIFD